MSETETRTSYYRARYYDANPGRFLNEDPLQGGGGGPNFYQYVRNNSTNLVDPFGLSPYAPAIPWPWKPISIPIPWGKVLGVTGRAVAIGLTVALELTVGAEATSSTSDVVPKPCDKDKVVCYLNGEYKDPAFDPKFKMCSYSCSDGSVRVRVIHIFLPCPAKWDGN